jgi:hypothetical protein
MDEQALGPEQSIGAAQFARVLVRALSPAMDAADDLAALPPRYGIDRAVALAFFAHESGFGQKGICAAYRTRNWGNLRRGYLKGYAQGQTPHPFAIYASWADGLADFCALLAGRYIGRGLTTVERAIPVYAPASDNNRPERYIAAVRSLVARWIAEEQARTLGGRYVVTVSVGNVRSGAGRSYAVLDRVRYGQPLHAEAIVTGEAVGDEVRWLRLRARRYVHHSLVEPAT